MSEQAATAIPLVDLLRQVPRGHRTEWETQWDSFGRATGHAICPIGLLCHQAADRIGGLEKQLAEAKAEIEQLKGEKAELNEQLADFVSLVNESEGVYGYHLNGALAPWDSLDLPLPDTGVTNE